MRKLLLILSLCFLFVSPTFAATSLIKIYPIDDGSNILYDNDGQTTWDDARNYSGLIFRQPSISDDLIATRADKQSGKYRIYRSSILFDTSVIPDNAVVISAAMHGYRGYSNNHGQKLVLTTHNRASSTQLTRDDWYLSHYGDELARGDLLQDQYTRFDFNDVGVSYINLTGYTDIGGMIENDYDDIDIGFTQSGATIYSSEAPGTSTDPYLEVTYEISDKQKNLNELNEQLLGLVDALKIKSIKNSYLAHVKKVLKFYENSQLEAAANQVEAFLRKLTNDVERGRLNEDVAEPMEELGNDILEKIAETVAGVFSVPLVTQIASPYALGSEEWEDDLYGNGVTDPVCGNTIGGCGCAITSYVMVARAFGITHGIDGSEVNPRNFNNWLATHGGYDANNAVIWGKALEYFTNGNGMTSIGFHAYVTDNQVISEEIANGALAVAYESVKGHYIALTGIADGLGFTVRDPLWYETTTTNDTKNIANHVQNYGGDVDKAKLFFKNDQLQPLKKMVEIHLNSPAELLLVDGARRKTGYDPESGEFVNDIPGVSYDRTETVLSSDSVVSRPHYTKTLFIEGDVEDLYELRVVGTDDGSYTLDIFTTGGRLASELSRIESTTASGQVDEYMVDVPNDAKVSRAPERLRQLAELKEAEKPEVASKLREIADRLDNNNYAAVSDDLGALLVQ